jgi:drug/metabolite transporter (DMT)-like permease
MSEARQRQLLVLCLATVYCVWGTSYIATRVGVTSLPPLLFGGIRFLISGALLYGVALTRGFAPVQFTGQWRHLAVMSLLGIALCNGLQVWAMQWVPANTSALLNASSALWIVVFGLFGARAHRPSSRAVVGLAIGFVGTALLIWPHTVATPTPLIPQLAILLACVVWSSGTIYMRNASVNLDLFAMLAAQMIIGGLLMVLVGLARGEWPLWHHTSAGYFSLAYLVIFSSGFAYTAYAWLARHATPAQTGTYSYVNPAIAAVVGFFALGEHMSGLQIAGGLVILAGVILVNWPTRGSISRYLGSI